MPVAPLQVMDSWLEDFRTKLATVSGLKEATEETDGSKGLPPTHLLISKGNVNIVAADQAKLVKSRYKPIPPSHG